MGDTRASLPIPIVRTHDHESYPELEETDIELLGGSSGKTVTAAQATRNHA